jgi:hypothetical protein
MIYIHVWKGCLDNVLDVACNTVLNVCTVADELQNCHILHRLSQALFDSTA